MIQTEVAVIGGGAAGLMAAVWAARTGADTVIIEHKDRVGKKILATGNGKCNFTNELQGALYYRGRNPAFVLPVFEQFGLSETLSFFKELGIFPKSRNGYYYPASGQASSVLDALRMEAEYCRVHTEVSCEIRQIRREGKRFCIVTNKDTFLCRAVIFAPGLLASPKTGSDGSAFPYIEQFGHHFIDIVPALTGLQAKQSYFKALAGIRAECRISLYIDGVQIQSEKGEIQLAGYGISGIPVFQLSRFASEALREGKKVYAELDFVPYMEDAALYRHFAERFGKNARGKCAGEALIGLFPEKLTKILLKESGIRPELMAERVQGGQIRQLCRLSKHFPADITGARGFDQAQVCAGGVDTAEINGQTMESKLVRGIYFAGEVVDIDGMCGGYNLQWAWSSGHVAGKCAAMRVAAEKSGQENRSARKTEGVI